MSDNLSQILAARPLSGANVARNDFLYIVDASESTAANKDKGIFISELNRALAGGYNAQTWASGALTITPDTYVGRHLEVLTCTMSAGSYALTLSDGTGSTRFAGERLLVLFKLPATSSIIITVSNSTGDELVNVATDGTGDDALVEFYHDGTKWQGLRKTHPLGL